MFGLGFFFCLAGLVFLFGWFCLGSFGVFLGLFSPEKEQKQKELCISNGTDVGICSEAQTLTSL